MVGNDVPVKIPINKGGRINKHGKNGRIISPPPIYKCLRKRAVYSKRGPVGHPRIPL